jgi:uncharacterized damage-inducible protein DinB
MNTLQEFFRYNRWADERVFKVCERADAALLVVDAGGTNVTVLSTLAHMVSVAEGFAALVTAAAGQAGIGAAPGFMVTPDGLAEGYFDHQLHWYAERQAYLDDCFSDLVGRSDEDTLARPVFIPWMGFEMPIQQALMQVLVHCGHHRSQVFSALGAEGVRVPDLDYIVMLAKERKAG